MNNQIRITIGWLLLVVGMILHFDYHVSEIFYGIDVTKPGSNGTVPAAIVIIRAAFHLIPILLLLTVASFNTKLVRLGNFIATVLYGLSHIMHLVGELRAPKFNPSQVALLSIVAVVAAYMVFVSWRWYLNDNSTQTAI